MERGDPDCEEVKMWSFMWSGLKTSAEQGDDSTGGADADCGVLMGAENPDKFKSARSMFTSATAKLHAEKKAAVSKYGQKPE